MVVITIYTLVRFLDEGTPRRASWHALTSAILIDIRIVGVFVPAMTLLLAAGDLSFVKSATRPLARRAAALALYLALQLFHRIPFSRTVRYLGQDLSASRLPWHHLPVWIAVTTPLSHLALFGAGLLTVAGSCLTTPARLFGRREARNRLVWALWCLGPVASVVVTNALVYDGWRHVYFAYPGLVMIAVEGARRLARWGRRLLGALLPARAGVRPSSRLAPIGQGAAEAGRGRRQRRDPPLRGPEAPRVRGQPEGRRVLRRELSLAEGRVSLPPRGVLGPGRRREHHVRYDLRFDRWEEDAGSTTVP
jgi:hypothetical protein